MNREFAKVEMQASDDDRNKSKLVILAQWESRPWTEKIKEHAAGPVTPETGEVTP